jgi:hypothetical protein
VRMRAFSLPPRRHGRADLGRRGRQSDSLKIRHRSKAGDRDNLMTDSQPTFT